MPTPTDRYVLLALSLSTLLCGIAAVGVGCGRAGDGDPGTATVASAVVTDHDDGFSADDWTVLRALSPLPSVPADPTNRYADSAAAARLGQRLFFEPRLSGPIQT